MIYIFIIGFLILIVSGGTQILPTAKTTTTPNKTSTDPNFQRAIKFVLKSEGGYSNNPKDPGGATNMGITQNTYTAWNNAHSIGFRDVKNITRAEVESIYFRNYWQAVGADKTTNYALALLLFDTAVNHGVSTSKKLAIKANYDINKFLSLRMQAYRNDRNWATFGKGWTNRISAIKSEIANA